MQIDKDKSTYVLPYQVIILDATDAYYYADIMDNMKLFDETDSLSLAEKLADALFIVYNYKWNSLEEMNKVDGGYDIRVYDQKYSCVYAAHKKYLNKWII
ncbi:MAG: hypothetical protein V1858_02845 [Candidatus Gottesmanbacteria bacterium]